VESLAGFDRLEVQIDHSSLVRSLPAPVILLSGASCIVEESGIVDSEPGQIDLIVGFPVVFPNRTTFRPIQFGRMA